MPLTEKGSKIKAAMVKQYGHKKGRQVFYASKNKGTIAGVDDDDRVPLEKGKSREIIARNTAKLRAAGHDPDVSLNIATRKAREDDFSHMGFTNEEATPIEQFVSECDALARRLDAFEARQHQRKPIQVKPRTKDNMQPSIPEPYKTPGG
jgi:hypothetical protein